ncbi:MAG: putative zinc ribbon domain protein [Candidatus Atribacteria bacterium ADurb.Bin276]|uniref:Putative zinc ribbon domain protein n=1 Tax=Candidatus Atribacter allofermentans TaxID=1852833 RepID=A0A1V5SLQ2_9BACT|nr:MAG: putative zinc ribbon domain protein [Candidatus Atribacteria bacterium ADurb.Bin276]
MVSTYQPQGPYCQSCSMPMQKLEDFGTNSNGNQNQEYCRYCYQNGNFTDPDITVEQMIEKCVDIMKKMNLPDMQIEQAKKYIPMLKRWSTKSV